MNLLLLGVLLALIAIAYQLGLKKVGNWRVFIITLQICIHVLVIMVYWLHYGAVFLHSRFLSSGT